MDVFITILILIVSILLGLIVLIQNPKGGGLGSAFGSANQIGGVRKTADFLEKATWTLAIGLVVLCLVSSTYNASQKELSIDPAFQQAAPTQQPIQDNSGGGNP